MAKQQIPENYAAFLDELKTRINDARLRASLAVNKELVLLYWSIGRDILAKQRDEGWGSQVIGRLARDLGAEFPGSKGFSLRNISYMRSFAQAYPDEQFVQQLVAQIPWGHNIRILDHLKKPEEREWYIRKTIENGWSRNVLELQIESRLYERQGKAPTNFSRTLPPPQSDLAQGVLKDRYNFEFLGILEAADERKIERGLVENLKAFLLELGKGFAFLGSQYALEIAGEDYRLDLLFYHVKLRCYVVFELKNGKFKPEYAGKMNFYLSAVDDMLRRPDDKPSIGIILCRTHHEVAVEYALRDVSKPMGISGFRVTQSLPRRLEESLPTIEELSAQIKKGTRTVTANEFQGTKAGRRKKQ